VIKKYAKKPRGPQIPLKSVDKNVYKVCKAGNPPAISRA
jgi:hypothetical protein